MARNVAASVENNFVRGLITEAGGLNFPENACTDTENCHFDITGSVRRRAGIDFENGFDTKTINRTGNAISTYLWKNVAGDGDTILWVVQIGGTLYFYDLSGGVGTVSTGALATTITLSTYSPAGADVPNAVECQFSAGVGYLFVTHPLLEPFAVSYDSSTQTVTGTQISVLIRDFVGIDDNEEVESRPASLASDHKYNLGNQGWTFGSYAVQTSSTNMTPGTGSKAFTVTAGGPWTAGDPVYIWSKGSKQGSTTDLHFMIGTVTSYVSTTLTVEVTSFGPDTGGTSRTDWQISDVTPYIDMFSQTIGIYPSNADVWWDFKDANEEFNPRLTMANILRGSTKAPKGHYILNLFNQDRATVSGIAGLTAVTTGVNRPWTSAFYAGRLFLAGISYQDYSHSIYFSQLIKTGEAVAEARCYQANDPTSEALFDLLPNDGGVISIPEAGQIFKLWAMQGGLIVFASRGIWQITGSTGMGFTANDYTVRQISTIKALSANSFVDIGGYPAWLSAEAIYILQPDQLGTSVLVKSLTDETVMTAYQALPEVCKKTARGFFDPVTKKIQWLLRANGPATIDEIYEYDYIVIFDVRTTAFSVWTISESDVKINAVVVVDNAGNFPISRTVVSAAGETVVDAAGDTVVVNSLAQQIAVPVFKYLVSYASGGSHVFTVAEEYDVDNYLDWYSYDNVGVDYTSYFISGYKVHGQAQRKFQSNYIYIFSQEIPSQYNFQAMWDWANTGDSGSWSSQTHQTVAVSNTNYDIKRNRLKIRGEGLALQFKVYSVSGQPFDIVGWSVWETGNGSI